MKKLLAYINEVLGIKIDIQPMTKVFTDKLPMYLKEGYYWHNAYLADKPCLFAEIKNADSFSSAQLEKHMQQVKTILEIPVITVFEQLEAFNRKRLIEKRIAFVVPNKQLYAPEFFIDLKEYGNTLKIEQANMIPIAQQLLLYYLLDRKDSMQIEQKTFKELAALLGVNQMGISRAAENLKSNELIEVIGDKEKNIHFLKSRNELWLDAQKRNLWINPVLKQVYVDAIPQGTSLLKSATSALPEYSDMNPSLQEFYAIEKGIYFKLKKQNLLANANKYEGKYCLEVWKYNPEPIVELVNNDLKVVDPLSLYISLMDNPDERIEMALEQILEHYLW
ncbi:MAG: hypothetical protein JEZ09_16870 [Salinivirgaceae bacterium]|nr:hypothetical protein [Salinivirgaceae bacterium]